MESFIPNSQVKLIILPSKSDISKLNWEFYQSSIIIPYNFGYLRL